MNIYVILYEEADRFFVVTSSIQEAIGIWASVNDMESDDEPDHVLRINDFEDQVIIDGSVLLDEACNEDHQNEEIEKDLEEKW